MQRGKIFCSRGAHIHMVFVYYSILHSGSGFMSYVFLQCEETQLPLLFIYFDFYKDWNNNLDPEAWSLLVEPLIWRKELNRSGYSAVRHFDILVLLRNMLCIVSLEADN